MTLAFIYIPLVVIAIYAFNGATHARLAAAGPHARLVRRGVEDHGARDAFLDSSGGPVGDDDRAVLGTLASLAVVRHRFFGRETVSFLVILPIALPGIVTGIALSDTFTQVLGVSLGLLTVIVPTPPSASSSSTTM